MGEHGKAESQLQNKQFNILAGGGGTNEWTARESTPTILFSMNFIFHEI